MGAHAALVMMLDAFRRLVRQDRAEVGVGTLIVFIAMVLVAAVAASVIISTSGSLQQRALATGKEATQEVSSNLMVVGMHGQRNSSAEEIWNLRIYLSLSAGSQEIDLNQTIVRYADGETTRLYKHVDHPDNGFDLTWVRGTGTDNVARSGDLIEMNMTLIDQELAPRTDFTLQLIQAIGAPAQVDVRTPATYSDDLYILLK